MRVGIRKECVCGHRGQIIHVGRPSRGVVRNGLGGAHRNKIGEVLLSDFKFAKLKTDSLLAAKDLF